MAKESSTMSPKRLFILLCLAGLLMWVFSNSEVEVEVSIDTDKNKVEELSLEDENQEETAQKQVTLEKKKTKKRKKNTKKESRFDQNDDYLKKRELNYDPANRNK